MSDLLREAVEHHRAGRLDEARALYNRVLEAEPRHADALHLLGVVSLESGDPKEAVRLIGESLAVNAESAEAHLNLGNALMAAGRRDEAVAAFERSLAIKPGFVHAGFNLAVTQLEAGRFDDAEAALAGCVHSVPMEASRLTHEYLAQVDKLARSLVQRQRYVDAVLLWQRALTLSHSNRRRREVYEFLLNLENPEDLLERLSGIERASAAALMADAHASRGNDKEAQRLALTTVEAITPADWQGESASGWWRIASTCFRAIADADRAHALLREFLMRMEGVEA